VPPEPTEQGRRLSANGHQPPAAPQAPPPWALALCDCNPGYYDPIIYADNATKLLCKPCPLGATCNQSGTTVQTMVIHRGHFRISNTSGDVKVCPDHISVVSFLSKPSGCKGGVGSGDSLCHPGLAGVYCQECSQDLSNGHYYNSVHRECRECVQSMPRGAWVLVSLLVMALTALLASRFAKGCVQLGLDQLRARFDQLASSTLLASLTVTAKTLIGFYQIISEVEEVFIMELPLKAVRFIKAFSWLHLDIADLIQLECIGLRGYTDHLRLAAATPAVLLLLLAIGAIVREAVVERRRGWELARSAALRALPWVLFFTFLVFPDMSSLAFRAFRCECFGDELTGDRQSWLRTDYSLQCTTNGCPGDSSMDLTPEWLEARRSAWAVLWVYAVGVPCVYGILLLLSRRTIISEEHTPLADALAFLHGGYRPSCFGWELNNVLQKLITVGFATLIKPGTLMQLVIVMLIMIAFQMLLIVLRPYRSFAAWLLAVVDQAALLMFMVLCLIVKAEQLAEQLPDDQMTDEIYLQFFYDTELIANTMVGSLVVAVSAAALASIHEAAPVAMQFWREALAFMADAVEEEPRSVADLLASARAAARDKLRVVLDQRASTLEVPAILHAEDAEINPVLHLNVTAEIQAQREAGKNYRRTIVTEGAGGGQPSSSRTKWLDGAWRHLHIHVSKTPQEEEHGMAPRVRALHLKLRRYQGVHGLVTEDMAPEEVESLKRRVKKVSKRPMTSEPEVLVRMAARTQLEVKGWKGAEHIPAWELLRLQIIRRRQGQDVEEETLAADEAAPDATADTGTARKHAVTEASRSGSQLHGLAREMFDRFDSSGDGLIDAKELALLCAHLGHELSDEQLKVAMHKLDVDGSGLISFDEFLTWFELGLSTNALKGQKSTSSELARHDEQVAASKQRLEDQLVAEEASRPQGFAVGQRVVHGKRGTGVVSELMEDGRTRVNFDNGEEHRYAPGLLYKLTSLDTAAAPVSLAASDGQAGSAGASPWESSRTRRGALTAVNRISSLQRPAAEGSLSRRRGTSVNPEREEMLESEQIIEQEASRRRGRRCSLSLKSRPGRETSRKPSATQGGTQPCAPRSGTGCSDAELVPMEA